MGDSVQPSAESNPGECAMCHEPLGKQHPWCDKLREQKMNLFGPPQGLVALRTKKDEDTHAVALKIRREMGLVTKWSLSTNE